jgi:phage FluMu protein Com
MATLFRCPDCKALHAEPAGAAYVLSVRCAACELETALVLWREFEDRPLPEAA